MGVSQNKFLIKGVIIVSPRKQQIEEKIELDLKDNDLQNHISKVSKDSIYNKFLEVEKEVLGKQILSDEKYKDVIYNGVLKFDLEDIGIGKANNNLNKSNLIDNILKNEETERVMEYKILDEIRNIKRNNEQHKIKYLTILLIGKKGFGSTTLIKYILGVKRDDFEEINIVQNENYISYSKNNFPLKIIEFKGIGYNESNNIGQISQNAFKCINELNSKNKRIDNSEFVHCIWYLTTGTRFVGLEKDLLKELRKTYKDDKDIPIIVVFNHKNKEISQQIKQIIINEIGKIDFVEVMPVDSKIIEHNINKQAFGRNELIGRTLKKCSEALKGMLIELMIDAITESVKNKMLERNMQIEKDINNNIEYEIKEFKTVLTNEELTNYVVNLFKDNIFYFYKGYNNKISNKTINELNQSSIIKCVESFTKYYKPEFEKIIIFLFIRYSL